MDVGTVVSNSKMLFVEEDEQAFDWRVLKVLPPDAVA
jgi:hypothetical protein